MSLQNEITEIRHKLIDRVLFATVIYILLPLISTILRTVFFGWSFLYLLHFLVAIALYIIFFLRKKLNLAVKSHTFLILYLIVSLAGIVSFKTISGFYFIAIVATIATIIFNLKTGLYYTAFYLIAYSSLAYLHIHNKLGNSIDLNPYINSPVIWITQITGILYVVLILLYAVSLFYKFFIESINNSFQINNELNETLKNLKSEEQRFYNVVESSNDGYLFVDKEFVITYVNGSFSKLTGYEKAEIIGKDYKSWLKERYENWDSYYQTLINAINKPNEVVYVDIINKNGNLNPVEINLYKSIDESKTYVWGVLKDLSETKRLENQVFITMIQSEEKERERYAKELHDGLGPLLSTAMIYINAVYEDSTDKTIQDFAQRAFDLLKESTRTIKEISNNLSPLILHEYGIVQAVRSFIEKVSNVGGIIFKIEDNTTKRFPENMEIIIYRALIELLNNSIKYSKAQNIAICFNFDNNVLSISYDDDGIGFDYAKTIEQKQGYGLMNIESRIKKLGGEYKYLTTPGKGVKVTILLKETCV